MSLVAKTAGLAALITLTYASTEFARHTVDARWSTERAAPVPHKQRASSKDRVSDHAVHPCRAETWPNISPVCLERGSDPQRQARVVEPSEHRAEVTEPRASLVNRPKEVETTGSLASPRPSPGIPKRRVQTSTWSTGSTKSAERPKPLPRVHTDRMVARSAAAPAKRA